MHDLRHTAVSTWIAHRASAKQVQVWAGHQSVATVFGRNRHLFPGDEDPVMDSIDIDAAPLVAGPERAVDDRADRAAGNQARNPCEMARPTDSPTDP